MKPSAIYIKSIVIAVAALTVSTAVACTCFYAGTFEVFAKKYPIIVRAVVDSHGGRLPHNPTVYRTMTVTVSETIKGSFPHTSFEFFGDTGMSCLAYITREDFPVGSEHFFILEDDQPSQPLMVCGEASVSIHGDSIQGHNRAVNGYDGYRMGIEEFISRIK